MVDFESQFKRGEYGAPATFAAETAAVFRQVYGWMAAGLALSGVVAWYVANSAAAEVVLKGPVFLICAIAEILLVLGISAGIRKLSPFAALVLFLVYAALNGLTLSVIFLAYDLALIGRAFFVSAAMFGGLAVWGTVTKGDLTSIGFVCGMALWGLIIASIVNIFLRSSGLDWAVSFAGVLIFSGLTMYDAQKIKLLAADTTLAEAGMRRKVALLGALSLYLDFINLFLSLLRLMGRKDN